METKPLTVGELRKALDGVPDDLEVRLSSDTGVDQGEGKIIVENAQRKKSDGCISNYVNHTVEWG